MLPTVNLEAAGIAPLISVVTVQAETTAPPKVSDVGVFGAKPLPVTVTTVPHGPWDVLPRDMVAVEIGRAHV